MKALKTALITIRRSPYQSLVSVGMIALTFFVGYLLSAALLISDKALQFLETRPQVIAFFDLQATTEAIESVATEIKSQPFVKNVTIVTKTDALKLYQEEHQQNPLLLELVTADILPASIEVSAHDVASLSKIRGLLESKPGVEDVFFQQELVDELSGWTTSLRLIGLGATGVLATFSFLLVVVVISMKITQKRAAIRIMKIIGATNWYVAQPFIWEGFLYGLLGSLVGWAGMFTLQLYLTPAINTYLDGIVVLPFTWEVYGMQAGIGTTAGVLLGSFASLVAIRRMLKRT